MPANPALQLFWDKLAAIQQLTTAGSVRLLQLGGSACFPLERGVVQGRLLVRQCYEDLFQLLESQFAHKQRCFIITGNPGEYYLMSRS